jgi:hypothetical protein
VSDSEAHNLENEREMKAGELERLIRTCLASFYKRRIAALDNLDLNRVLSRKNPYLFRATGIANAPEMISQLLAAHISSSDEGIFGDEFFEPICKGISKAQIAAAKGVDFVIETEATYEVISLKSGPNAFNSSQVSKQNQQFEEIKRSLAATVRRLRKEFIPVMGCGYGRADSPPTDSRRYYKLAGEALWERITGDPVFYLKLVRLMKDDPEKHRPLFKEAWDRAVNRFVREFTERFCDPAGNIEWEDLVRFNSGKQAQPGSKRLEELPSET